MNPSSMRVGIPVSPLMWIQKPSVSMSAPASPSIWTRMFVQRVDSAEHQRRRCTRSGHTAGRTTSMTVRRTIHSGWLSAASTASRLSRPASCR